MRLKNSIRQWLQWCFGILSLEKANQARNDEAIQRHLETMQQIGTILMVLEMINGRVGNLENRFTDQHVGRRPATEVYDWEQIQARYAAELEKNPEGEN